VPKNPWIFSQLSFLLFKFIWSNLPEYESVAVLNIAEDHIDWHGSFEAYAQAKLKLLKHSKQDDIE